MIKLACFVHIVYIFYVDMLMYKELFHVESL